MSRVCLCRRNPQNHTTAECPSEDCCCGHARSRHAYGTGMCFVCRRACEKFHRTGEGHFWAPIVLGLLIIIVAAGVAFGIWQLWFITDAKALMPF